MAVALVVSYLLIKEAKRRWESHAIVSVVGEATAQLKAGLKVPSREGLAKVEAGMKAASS